MNTNPKNCQNRLPAKGGTLTQKQPRTIKNNLKLRFLALENQQPPPDPQNARSRRGAKNTANTAEPSGAQGGTLTQKTRHHLQTPKTAQGLGAFFICIKYKRREYGHAWRCVSRMTVWLMPYSDARMRSRQEALPSCCRCIQLAYKEYTLGPVGPSEPPVLGGWALEGCFIALTPSRLV